MKEKKNVNVNLAVGIILENMEIVVKLVSYKLKPTKKQNGKTFQLIDYNAFRTGEKKKELLCSQKITFDFEEKLA